MVQTAYLLVVGGRSAPSILGMAWLAMTVVAMLLAPPFLTLKRGTRLWATLRIASATGWSGTKASVITAHFHRGCALTACCSRIS
jgi:hypothetical protein